MGALVHEVLYRCDLGDPDSASEWARRLCRDRGAEALTPDVERHARSVLESSAPDLVQPSTDAEGVGQVG